MWQNILYNTASENNLDLFASVCVKFRNKLRAENLTTATSLIEHRFHILLTRKYEKSCIIRSEWNRSFWKDSTTKGSLFFKFYWIRVGLDHSPSPIRCNRYDESNNYLRPRKEIAMIATRAKMRRYVPAPFTNSYKKINY